jgi:hypothetical protein
LAAGCGAVVAWGLTRVRGRVPPAAVSTVPPVALTGLLTRWEGTALAAIGAALIVLLHTAWGLLDQSLKRDQNASGPDTT